MDVPSLFSLPIALALALALLCILTPYPCLTLPYRCIPLTQVGPQLNYDEVVVYHEEAALPTFLIVYSML